MPTKAVSRCLVGGALGDSLGLPAEGMSAARISKRWPGPWRHHLFLGRGMVSDDTEHAVMTVLSLERSLSPQSFSEDLARRIRWWFAGVPAGIGLATARASLKLWMGVPPSRSGVHSAGNGPLMRAPVIGAWFSTDRDARRAFVEASTRITHNDPRAFETARIVAESAAWAVETSSNAETLFSRLDPLVESEEMKSRMTALRDGLSRGIEVNDFADSFGRKAGFVSGFAPDTAAVALFSWLRHRGDFRKIVTAAILAGGDTDTVAFVAGSLGGIETEVSDLPPEWLSGLRDYPIHAKSLTNQGGSLRLRFPNWPVSAVRNAAFLAIVLAHGFRRLLPPF